MKATMKQGVYDFLLASASHYYLAVHLQLHVVDIAFFAKFESSDDTAIDDISNHMFPFS